METNVGLAASGGHQTVSLRLPIENLVLIQVTACENKSVSTHNHK